MIYHQQPVSSPTTTTRLLIPSQKAEAQSVLSQVEAECGWMYLTLNNPKHTQITTAIKLLQQHRTGLRSADSGLPWGRINYTVWSDVFVCSNCSGEVVFWGMLQ